MPKVIITAQVNNGAQWEAGFATHADLFRTYELIGPVEYSVNGNAIAVCMETNDLAVFQASINSPDTAAAMAADGVIRETVKFYFLDKTLEI